MCTFLNLLSYSLEVSSFQKIFISSLFSPHLTVLKFICMHFRGVSLLIHCAFFKARGILHKFQMCHVLDKREMYFLFNFVTLLTYFSFLFFQDMNLPVYFSWFWLGAPWRWLWFARLMPSAWTAFHLFRYIYWAPFSVTNFLTLFFAASTPLLSC